MKGSLGVIGAGNMGEAITQGVLQSGLLQPDRVVLMDTAPPRLDLMKSRFRVHTVDTIGDLAKSSEIVIIAVKPQIVEPVLRELGSVLKNRHLVMSIAAGVTLSRLRGGLPEGARVIRAMPNTPALYLEGMTALSPAPTVTPEDMDAARAVFESVGRVVVVEESMMDAVTGLSGSGPAYVFVLIEALSDGGVRMGLPRETASALAVQTVLGAAVTAARSGDHPARLKDRVTSPGGTTLAGLMELERNAFRAALMDAVEAATLRSRELGGK